MKKSLFLGLILSLSFSYGQIKLGGRSNMAYNIAKPTLTETLATGQRVYEKGENSIGSNYGFFIQINFLNNVFIMPEAYYTSLNSRVLDSQNNQITVRNERIDVPLLFGKKMLGDIFSTFIGPVASYKLTTNNAFGDFRENATSNFSLGYQLGVQLKLNNLIFNARYEGAFSNEQRLFINKVTNQQLNYDSRNSILILGIGYQLF